MIEAIRFRAEGALMVLQVLYRKTGNYYDREAEWRDASVEDMLNAAAFMRTDVDRLYDRVSALESAARETKARDFVQRFE